MNVEELREFCDDATPGATVFIFLDGVHHMVRAEFDRDEDLVLTPVER
jgi:hypothetical protein